MPRESPTIRAVVFDLDGLMFNTEDLYVEVGTELLRRRGKRLTGDLLNQMMGRRSHVALQIMIDSHDLDASVEQLQAETDALFPELLDQQLAPMPGLLDLFEALESAKLPKAIATSSRMEFVDNVLSRFDFRSRFEFILTAEDVSKGKPDPEVYLLAAKRLDIAPDEMLVLEDSENGCRAGVSAGAFTVAVPGERSGNHDFAGAALIADSLRDSRIYDALDLPC